jgi:hypothetical protein
VTANPVKVGDKLEFGLGYRALMTAMASPYVSKEILSTTETGLSRYRNQPCDIWASICWVMPCETSSIQIW